MMEHQGRSPEFREGVENMQSAGETRENVSTRSYMHCLKADRVRSIRIASQELSTKKCNISTTETV